MPGGIKFWIVWSPQGARPPTCRHASEASARNEAQRLAHLHPNHEFFVLEATGVAQQVTVTWTDLDEVEIPF